MGYYADIEISRQMRRGLKASVRTPGQNPITASCMYCKKGIRPIAGRVEESLKAHIKAKHKGLTTP